MSKMGTLLILSFLLVFAAIASATKDPEKELQQCQIQCGQQGRFDQRQVQECRRKCERYEGVEREEQSEREQEGEPYVFQDQHFSTEVQTDHGRVRILQRFDERELLRGIENFRVVIVEANPQTFLVPNHWDADTIIFVQQGRATISLVRQDKRESFNVRQGDVLKIQAGTAVYLVNPEKNEKLVLVKLVHPVSTIPGHFEAFFGSFFRAFSSEFLEAAFNTKGDIFEKVFQQLGEGVIIKASEEQIRGMSHHEEGGIWPFGSESKGPYNLFKHEPSQSNQHGKFYEVGPSKFGDLRELDLGVAFANISRGSMMAPMFNSRATKIAIVVRGKGDLEIACPHLSSSEFSRDKEGKKGQHGGGSSHQRQTTPSYQRVRANLRSGTVYVIPAGHPFITVASQNENLEVVCFEVKAQDNEKVQLAGRKNIFNHFERDAKELAFGVSEKDVDEVFKSQKEEFFVKWPRQQPEGRAYA